MVKGFYCCLTTGFFTLDTATTTSLTKFLKLPLEDKNPLKGRI